jgi:hypothetical protein
MKRRALLVRVWEDKTRTLGYLMILEDHMEVCRLAILELPDRDNRRNISRIPSGIYKITPDHLDRLGYCVRVHAVPGRSEILIHSGNYPRHSRGCLLAGIRFVDLDDDGLFDASQSMAAMNKLQNLVPEAGLLLRVIDACEEGE